jgi:tetratricopeptide (TPR) repeat protein
MASDEWTDAVEEVVRWLTAPGPAPVLLLSGEPGSGRSALLASAVKRAGEEGAPAAVLSLDLAGFEEGAEGLVGFLSLWGQRHRAETEEVLAARLERVAELAGELPPSMASATLLSLLLDRADLVENVQELGDPQHPWEILRRLFDRLAAADRCILHILRSSDLDGVTRRRLLAEAERNPRLLLAFSCDDRDSGAAVAPGSRVCRMSVTRAARESDLLLEPLRDLLGRVGFRAAELLGRFVDLAALCGENVPSDLLMAHLDVTQEEREELLDLIDESLVADEDREEGEGHLFVDFQYGHPSFPGLLLYSFLTPALRQGLLDHVPPAKRKGLAGELLDFLRRHIPVATRGIAQLFLALADPLGAEEREPYLRQLDWWISPGDEEALSALIREDLEAARLDPRAVLEIANQTAGTWPPPHRLALLAAVERNAPSPFLGDTHYLRAVILREAGNPAEALEETHRALAAADGADALRAAILTLSGVLYGDLNDFPSARRRFEESLAAHRALFGDRHPTVAACMANLASLYRHVGDRESARDLFAQALALVRETQGEDHPFTQALRKAVEDLAG